MCISFFHSRLLPDVFVVASLRRSAFALPVYGGCYTFVAGGLLYNYKALAVKHCTAYDILLVSLILLPAAFVLFLASLIEAAWSYTEVYRLLYLLLTPTYTVYCIFY